MMNEADLSEIDRKPVYTLANGRWTSSPLSYTTGLSTFTIRTRLQILRTVNLFNKIKESVAFEAGNNPSIIK